MKNLFKNISIVFITLFALLPFAVFAHQPYMVTELDTIVEDPEISTAYYGKLLGEPHIYHISVSKPLELYVNLLVPDIEGQKKDISAAIIRNGDLDNPISVLEGINFEWTKFWEPFGYDSYWKGPEYKSRVESGVYEIRVWSSNNDSKYSIAIGEIESFDFIDTINTIKLISKIKREFFNELPLNFIFSPIGYGYVFTMFFLGLVVGLIFSLLLRKLLPNSEVFLIKSINKSMRFLLLFFGFALIFSTIITSWSPLPIFASGFIIFLALKK